MSIGIKTIQQKGRMDQTVNGQISSYPAFSAGFFLGPESEHQSVSMLIPCSCSPNFCLALQGSELGEDQVQDQLRNLKLHKPIGPDKMHLQVLGELVDVHLWLSHCPA